MVPISSSFVGSIGRTRFGWKPPLPLGSVRDYRTFYFQGRSVRKSTRRNEKTFVKQSPVLHINLLGALVQILRTTLGEHSDQKSGIATVLLPGKNCPPF